MSETCFSFKDPFCVAVAAAFVVVAVVVVIVCFNVGSEPLGKVKANWVF